MRKPMDLRDAALALTLCVYFLSGCAGVTGGSRVTGDCVDRPTQSWSLEDCERKVISGKLTPEQLSRAFNALGYAYFRRGELYTAIGRLDLSIGADPTNEVAYRNRGYAYYEQGKYRRAIQDFDQALTLDKLASTYYLRGNAYHKLGELRRATEDYDSALRLDPDHAFAKHARAIAVRKLGD